MALLDCRVSLSESDLMVWNPVMWVEQFVDPFKYKFFQYF